MICKIGSLFVNTLNANDKHFLLNRDNLTQPIQMQLSHKQKTFSEFFFAFLKSILNFKHFQKKMTLIADVFPELLAPKNLVRSMSKKLCFRGPFDGQNGKWVETFVESERQNL